MAVTWQQQLRHVVLCAACQQCRAMLPAALHADLLGGKQPTQKQPCQDDQLCWRGPGPAGVPWQRARGDSGEQGRGQALGLGWTVTLGGLG